MSKKSQGAAVPVVEQAEVQASAAVTEEAVSQAPTDEQLAADQVSPEQIGDASSSRAAEEEEPVRGRALVDLPAYDLKCGEFGSLPYATARALWANGYFDPRAIEP